MNNFSPPLLPYSLPYAETHYKFKLPWSPLHKKWPEVFLDGPSFCVPGIRPVFYLVVKDADYFPIRVHDIEIFIQSDGQTRKVSLPLDRKIAENLLFIPLEIDFTGLHGKLTFNGRITVENAKGQKRTFLNANFPGISPSPLQLHILAHPLPYPADWHGGELHCHSDYSNDPVEYGAPLAVLQEAAKALGMGYVVCTDHSYDFYYDKRRYMDRVDPHANFQAYRSEAIALNARHVPEGGTVLIPGEEVSCGNHLGENVHLLVAGHEEFLPGLGDGGRRWLNNKPDLGIAEVLQRLKGAPRFAAHPRSRVGTLERFIFRRGMWHEQDVRHNDNGGIGGLQFWNGNRGRDFVEGRAFWISQLLTGRRLSPIGSNDAHGDLNRNIGVKTPLFSLYQNRNHVFGHVRTVVYSPERTIAGMQAGLASGNLFCTDGPALRLVRENDGLRAHGKSMADFGVFEKVTIFSGKRGEARETVVREWKWKRPNGAMELNEAVEISTGAAYVRAEARTTERRFAMTAPVYT